MVKIGNNTFQKKQSKTKNKQKQNNINILTAVEVIIIIMIIIIYGSESSTNHMTKKQNKTKTIFLRC